MVRKISTHVILVIEFKMFELVVKLLVGTKANEVFRYHAVMDGEGGVWGLALNLTPIGLISSWGTQQ